VPPTKNIRLSSSSANTGGVVDYSQALMKFVQRISHHNWQTAEVLVQTGQEMARLDAIEREAWAIHRLNPNRRPPQPLQIPGAVLHPSRQAAAQAIAAQPLGTYTDVNGQQSSHWGYFLIEQVSYQVEIHADCRESAILGHQTLQLLCQDDLARHDLISYKVQRVRLQQDLSQLGYCDGAGTFSLRAVQNVPQMAHVAAHQIGHLIYGAGDAEADNYASAYSNRNRQNVLTWQQQAQQTSISPGETMKAGLELVGIYSPDAPALLKQYRVRSTEATEFATPQDVATQLVFVGLQQRSEQQLASQGINIELPLDMPDCISHHAVNVYRPGTGAGGHVAPVVTSLQVGDRDWQADPQLSQQARYYPKSYWEYGSAASMAEGGRCVYRGIEIVGTKRNVERIQQALDECWADEEARQKVWKRVKRIYAVSTEEAWGLSCGGGQITAEPNRNVIDIAGTLFHEALHEDGLGENQHPLIRQLQNAFVQRRRWGRTRGTPAVSAPRPRVAATTVPA